MSEGPEHGSPEELVDEIRRLGIGQLLFSTASMVVSLAFGKLESGELDEARLGIDAVRALLPVLQGQIDEGMKRDLDQAVASLQLAYANAVLPG
jgi:hypothetical protein